jgi:hypothetical protein
MPPAAAAIPTSPSGSTDAGPPTIPRPGDNANELPAHRQAPRPRPGRQDPRARRYRVTRYGHCVMTAAIALHDDNFADHYRAACTTNNPVSRVTQIVPRSLQRRLGGARAYHDVPAPRGVADPRVDSTDDIERCQSCATEPCNGQHPLGDLALNRPSDAERHAPGAPCFSQDDGVGRGEFILRSAVIGILLVAAVVLFRFSRDEQEPRWLTRRRSDPARSTSWPTQMSTRSTRLVDPAPAMRRRSDSHEPTFSNRLTLNIDMPEAPPSLWVVVTFEGNARLASRDAYAVAVTTQDPPPQRWAPGRHRSLRGPFAQGDRKPRPRNWNS